MVNQKNFPIKIKENFPLANLTTFGIGGPARFFCIAKSNQELVKTIIAAKEKGLEFFILGGGSNVLIADSGFPGLVIKADNQRVWQKDNQIMAQSGARLASIVKTAADHNLSGLECCFGIPGTVGGAIVGNAGAKDQWLDSVIEEVKVLTQDNQIIKFGREDCQFGYRTSRFPKNQEIVLQATFSLKPSNKEEINRRQQLFRDLRKSQPKQKSAGSIFKNPTGKSAGQLIDQTGLKGKRVGEAQISSQHANFIINLGQARANDVLTLIKEAQAAVLAKFNLRLQPEIKLIGFAKSLIKDII